LGVAEVDCVATRTRDEQRRLSFEIVDAPRNAAPVVLMESCSRKTQRDPPDYRAFVLEHGAHRLVCLNYDDKPLGFLPRLYFSLESFRLCSQLRRS
jgi:hypothetical protein